MEQNELKGKLEMFKGVIPDNQKPNITAREFEERKKLINKYSAINELNPQILAELIDKIEISQGYYDDKKVKHQKIKIYYKFCANVAVS